MYKTVEYKQKQAGASDAPKRSSHHLLSPLSIENKRGVHRAEFPVILRLAERKAARLEMTLYLG